MYFCVSTDQCPTVIYVGAFSFITVVQGLATLKSPKIRFEDGVMYTLVCPQPRVGPNPSGRRSTSNTQLSLMILLALVLGTTACSTLNAGSTANAASSRPIAISAALPAATVGTAYSSVISVSGGTAPYHFMTRVGQLPPGLALNSTTGSISGTPRLPGSYNFTIAVSDNESTAEGVKSLQVTVKRPVTTPPVSVEVSPSSVTLTSGAIRQFAALVSNANSPAVTWKASAGAVTAAGVFTAPQVTVSTTIQLTATSQADPSKIAAAMIVVEAASAPSKPTSLTLTSTSLPEATEGSPYTTSLHAYGGQSPYQWKLTGGNLPSGFSLTTEQGTVHGITSQSGTFGFTALVTDASGQTASQKLTVNVALSSNGNFDGPAELPRVYMSSGLSDTPAPGAVHHVSTATALQATIDSAKCGDTIALDAGSTFTGTFVLPAKNCDDNHWVVLRTSAPNSALPPEGTRLTPCYAGVASLPGRPTLQCASTKNVLAKLVFDGVGSGPIVLGDHANHYRLIGLEITRTESRAVVYNLVTHEKDGTSDHIVFDRLWLHGTAHDETTRGIMLSGSTYTAVVDSYMSDFHCVAISGSCGDSQAIGGGLGNTAMGPYKITNNFMEAAGETIILGGGPATVVPTDIEVRGNHLFKPTTWMKGSPNFVGGRDGHPFIVKNLFELKNAQRVLLEGNILDNAWGGFSQVGFAILLTPKNQSSAEGSVCPICLVTDVTIRYNLVRHTAAGMQIGNGISSTGGAPRDGQRYSIHDVIFEDIDGTAYNGTGVMAQVSMGKGAPLMQNVKIDHVTAVPVRTLFVFGDDTKANRKMTNFSFTNSIASAGPYPFLTGPGGEQDCTYRTTGISMLNSCFASYEFSHNAIIAPPKSWPVSVWPEGNFFPANTANVHFTDDQPARANYLLQPSSPYKNAGTDGKDLGADISAVTAAITNVE